MNKIDIVYVVPYLINSGPINVLYNIVKNLDRNVFNLTIISLVDNRFPEKSNKALFEKLQINIIEYPYSNLYLQFNYASIAQEIEQSYNASSTIFHAHGYYPTLVLSKMKNALTINTIHNICDEDFKMTKGFLMGSYMSYMYKRAFRNLTLSVPITDFMKDYYEKDKSLKLQTIYNGVDGEDQVYSLEHKNQIKSELNIPIDAKVLLYPAVFSEGKNHVELIKAIKECKENVFVLFAGHGPKVDECKQLVGEDRHFCFLGFQMNLSKYWAVADFMISTSKSEGLPMAVLEALVRGIPCILSNILPHQEVIQKVFNSTQLCYQLGDIQSLVDCIKAHINVDYNHSDIQQKARNYYSSQVMAEGYSNLYIRLSKE